MYRNSGEGAVILEAILKTSMVGRDVLNVNEFKFC